MDFSQMLRGAVPTVGELRYGFVVAGLRLVPAARVLTEMVADARVFPVPKSGPGLAGVLNLRGTIVPVLSRRHIGVLHRGEAGERRETRHIRPFQHRALVFDRDEHRIGLLLDDAPQLLALQAAPVALVQPATALSGFLTRPWARVDQPEEIWWEFSHRAAFESLARGQQPAAQPTVAVSEEVIA